ncbi:OmpA/MotB domain-containing protein [Galbibacter marinus]|uniref:OmpA/MotB domain-containing protein n=1 Tax=Galbibacter marinus TaxID=555500 RepID=K2PTR9_9FLAO|nr:OmpA family protein [Galbibacter marinus]EKF55985.1 OmpA/MotB domain-containing protein [Galbibacter marinus]
MKKTALTLLTVALLASCVSKKKYVALENQNGELKSQLQKTQVENEELEGKFAAIQERVDEYNNKISSLTDENNSKMVTVGDAAVISENTKAEMRKTLANVDPALVSQATTLKDSMNLAITHNLQTSMSNTDLNEDEDIAINIDETVVMISISDKLLFNTASYRISNKADDILQKLADVINSEPSIEVMVEGHTDSRSIHNAKVQDNWDLSVLRATSVVRKLQNEFNVAPEKMIASGRGEFQPLVGNETQEDRSKNRRTRIVLLPNINKFFALMASNE